jgi:hypothetical protein
MASFKTVPVVDRYNQQPSPARIFDAISREGRAGKAAT